MTIDIITETDIITDHLNSRFIEPVYEGYPDGQPLTYTGGHANPYLTVDYGSPVATARDRSICTEPFQPYTIRVIVSAISDDANISRRLQNKAIQEILGFVPSTNSSELRLVGGGGFTITVSPTVTLKVAESYFRFTSNLAFP